MGLELTWQDASALWEETAQQAPLTTSSDGLEIIQAFSSQVGDGYERVIMLQPGVQLCIFDRVFHDLTLQMPENLHPVQFIVYLSGITDSADSPRIDSNQGCISGSGMQRPFTAFFPGSQRQIGISIEVQPQIMAQFFGTPTGELPPEMQPFILGDNHWQKMVSPKTTGAMRTVTQQIFQCPFQGAAKQLYLQGKAFELMALQVDAATEPITDASVAEPRPDTVERIYYAAEILRSHLEYPPDQTHLARQVGLGTRTLQNGFKAIFGLTPFAYLTQQRMHRAEQLLRQPDCTVAEVANIVGYANPSQFAAAFKRYFGRTPSDCLRGKKIKDKKIP